jgi:hypothetical protein
MSVRFAQLVIDCVDAAAQARFWSAVLQHPVDPGANEYFATIGRTEGEPLRPAFMFIAVPERRVGKNRLHVDLTSPDWQAEVQRVLALGAERVSDHEEFGTAWTTLRDPEGNVFDIGAGIG